MHEEPTAVPATAPWGLWTAAASPVLLVGGWTWAAARQPTGFDPVRDSISALAGLGASQRWIMTCALLGVGACHVLTATALRAAPRSGRLLLGLGGAATVGVAAAPLPATGASSVHALFAAIAFIALAVWPALPLRADAPAPRTVFPLRRPVRAAVAAALTALVCWFGVELVAGGHRLGLAERVAAGAQAAWPLVTAVGCRRRPADGE